MKFLTLLVLLFLPIALLSDYEYQLDPIIANCNATYGAHYWEFIPILAIPYEIKDSLNLPSFFSGYLIDGASSDTSREIPLGTVWENNARDSSYLMVTYWSKQAPKNIKYKVFWFIK